MRTGPLTCLLALTAFCSGVGTLPAEDEALTQLSKVAEAYVAAYNEKKVDDMVALYTAEAEMIDEIDGLSASGPEEIRSIFERSFENYPDRRISLEVLSVRQVAKNVVIEEGIARFSGEVPNEEGDAVFYATTLVNEPEKGWLIASSRELKAESPELYPLEDLYLLEGDWVSQGEQITTQLSVAMAPSGRYFIGNALISTPPDGLMETDLRIGFDASTGEIRWWTFDEMGGFTQGVWQALEDGWLVRSNGVTSDGEITSALQEMSFEGDDTLLWKSTRRFLDGLPQPDISLRLVRRPPVPNLSFDTESSDEEESTDSATVEAPEADEPDDSDADAAPAAAPAPDAAPATEKP